MKIAISSGKGGTGKTFIATNLAKTLSKMGKEVRYLDCDVEEPNGHLFLKPKISKDEDASVLFPIGVDKSKCTKCGKCAKVCKYNAIAMLGDNILYFPQLCHVCGACTIVCPVDAIVKKERTIGLIKHGKSENIDFHYGLLNTGEGSMTVKLIKKVKEYIGSGINILDSAPGTSCPVVATVKDVDLCVFVTDPTPFGVNDLKLAVDMAREVGQEPVVVVNRADSYSNELYEYCKQAELEIAGEIPDDRKIAEVYSVGNLIVDKSSKYRKVFKQLAEKIIELAQKKRIVKKQNNTIIGRIKNNTETSKKQSVCEKRPNEIVIISGKGGTGKTSICASFAALAKNSVIADCDVDASDLHLILKPQVKEKGDFSGGQRAEIQQYKCTNCGACYDSCQFNAVIRNGVVYKINPIACEGCGVCELICKDHAVIMNDAVNGEWYISDTRFGPMSHAKLGVAEENSGKLVSLVRTKLAQLADKSGSTLGIIDGSPGTGCPVISSLVGSKYAVIVTEPTVSGVHDMMRILDVTKHFDIPAGVIVNKADLNKKKTKEIKELVNKNNNDFLGEVPYDKAVTHAQIKGISIVEYSNGVVSESIKNIWGNIISQLKKGGASL
ncbi:MAG: P-loop NTPase [Endomicrobiaceae bacterium]|nr:P-loop NTPase [Endomicrobiaceae bacterium]